MTDDFGKIHSNENLRLFSRSLIKDIEAHYQDPNKPYPSEENPLMSELSTYLESAGIHDPLKKVSVVL